MDRWAFCVLVDRPKLDVPKVDPGLLKFVLLNALKASARYCSRKRSVMKKFLKRPRSKFLNPGPRKAFRPRLPYVYRAGEANAAGSKYRPPGPYCFVQPDGNGSPTRFGRWKLPREPTFAMSFGSVMLKGRPVSNVTRPVVCQPPMRYFVTPLRLPAGIIQV